MGQGEWRDSLEECPESSQVKHQLPCLGALGGRRWGREEEIADACLIHTRLIVAASIPYQLVPDWIQLETDNLIKRLAHACLHSHLLHVQLGGVGRRRGCEGGRVCVCVCGCMTHGWVGSLQLCHTRLHDVQQSHLDDHHAGAQLLPQLNHIRLQGGREEGKRRRERGKEGEREGGGSMEGGRKDQGEV